MSCEFDDNHHCSPEPTLSGALRASFPISDQKQNYRLKTAEDLLQTPVC